MEQRVAKTSAVSATATLAIASVTIAVVTGGIFVSAAASAKPGVRTIEMVDEYIVVHSPTTTTTTTLAPVEVAPVTTAATTIDALELIVAPARAAVSPFAASVPETTGEPVPNTPATDAPVRPDDAGVGDDSHESDHDDDSAEDESDDDHYDDGTDHHSEDEEEDHETDD